MPIIVPYTPSPAIDWKNIDIDETEGPAEQDHEQLRNELRRFHYRDVLSVVVGMAYWVGSTYFVLRNVSLGWEWTINAVFTMVVVACIPVILAPDVVVHARQSRSSNAGTIRQVVAVLVACCLTHMIAFRYQRATCLTNHYTLADLKSNSTENTERFERRDRDCTGAFFGYHIVSLAVALPTLRLYPLPGFIILGYCVVGYFAGYAIPVPDWARYEPNTRLIIADSLIYLTFAIGCGLIMMERFRTSRLQFFAAARYEQARARAASETDMVNTLLQSTLPESVMERVVRQDPGEPIGLTDFSHSASVLLAQFVDFDRWSHSRSAEDLVTLLNTLILEFDEVLGTCEGVVKVKTVGDGYWAMSGMPELWDSHASSICQLALALQRHFKLITEAYTGWGALEMRAGVGSGALAASIYGTLRLTYEPFGPTSESAAVSAARCPSGRVTVTESTRLALLNEFSYDEVMPSRGAIQWPQTVADVENIEPLGADFDIQQQLFLLPASSPIAPVLRKTDVLLQSTQRPVSGEEETPDQIEYRLRRRRQYVVERARQAAKQRKRAKVNAGAAAGSYTGSDTGTSGVDSRLTGRVTGDVDDESVYEPRWKWAPAVFAYEKADLEAEFARFATDVSKRLRVTSRALTLAMACVLGLCLTFVPNEGSLNGGITCISLAIVTAIVNVVFVCIETRFEPLIDSILPHVVPLLIVVAAMLSRGTLLGNDTTFTALIPVLLTGPSVPWLSPLLRTALQLLISVLALVQPLSDNVLEAWAGVPLVILSTLFLASQMYVSEALLRQQFKELRLARQLAIQQDAAKTALWATLTSIVPDHVVSELSIWVHKNFDPELSVSRWYETAVVAHMHLVTIPSVEPSPSVASSQQQHSDESAEVPKYRWLGEAHGMVDSLLNHCSVIEKVKTIGDAILIAGPLAPDRIDESNIDGGVRNAVGEVVYLAMGLGRVGLAATVGIHVGSVIGAVLGTERLSFDLIGDTVTVAQKLDHSALDAKPNAPHDDTAPPPTIALTSAVAAYIGPRASEAPTHEFELPTPNKIIELRHLRDALSPSATLPTSAASPQAGIDGAPDQGEAPEDLVHIVGGMVTGRLIPLVGAQGPAEVASPHPTQGEMSRHHAALSGAVLMDPISLAMMSC